MYLWAAAEYTSLMIAQGIMPQIFKFICIIYHNYTILAISISADRCQSADRNRSIPHSPHLAPVAHAPYLGSERRLPSRQS